jgi:1-phosphofructokinase family hexose kinase
MAIFTIGLNPAIDRILECPDFHPGGTHQARLLARLASGKAANVSRALAQVSVNSTATGFLGISELAFYHAQLSSCRPGEITCQYVAVRGKTRENITILDLVHHRDTHLRDRGFAVTPQEISHLDNTLRRELKPRDIAIFSGSLCPGLPDTYIASTIDLCARLGARVVVDSNGPPMKLAARQKMWLMKPNLEELREILDQPIPDEPLAIRDAALQLLDTAEVVLISRGRNGAVLLTRDGGFLGSSLMDRPPVRTVSCGDHLLAGFIASAVGGHDTAHNFRHAIGLATARALSTQLDVIDAGILEEAAKKAEIQKI